MKRIELALFYMILFLTIFGGFKFQLGTANIEFGVVNPWALAFTLLVAISIKLKGTSAGWEQVDLFLTNLFLKNPRKKAFLLIVVFGLVAMLAHLFKHWIFKTHALDATYVNQSLHFPFDEVLLKCDLCKGGSRFGEHLGATLLLLAPVTQHFQSEEFIIILQNILVFLGIGVVFFFGPLKDNSKILFYGVILFLCHKSLKYFTIWDFKEDHLGFLFCCLVLLALYKKKLALFSVFLLGALASKEIGPFILPFLLFPVWLSDDLSMSRRQKMQFSVVLVGLSLAWAYIGIGLIMPAFSIENGGAGHFKRMGVPGGSLSEILINLVTMPSVWWMILTEKILKWGVLKYLLFLFAPVIFFLKTKWSWFFVSFPMVMINVISSFDTQRSLRGHYEAYILPFLLFGLLLALKDMSWERNRKKLIWALLIALCFSGRWPAHFVWRFFPSKGDIQNIFFFEKIPEKIIFNDKSLCLNASLRVHAQTSHIQSLCKFDFDLVESLDSVEDLRELLRKQSTSRGHDRIRFVLDLRQNQQARFFDQIRTRWVAKEIKSKSGNLVYFQLEKSLEELVRK